MVVQLLGKWDDFLDLKKKGMGKHKRLTICIRIPSADFVGFRQSGVPVGPYTDSTTGEHHHYAAVDILLDTVFIIKGETRGPVHLTEYHFNKIKSQFPFKSVYIETDGPNAKLVEFTMTDRQFDMFVGGINGDRYFAN